MCIWLTTKRCTARADVRWKAWSRAARASQDSTLSVIEAPLPVKMRQQWLRLSGSSLSWKNRLISTNASLRYNQKIHLSSIGYYIQILQRKKHNICSVLINLFLSVKLMRKLYLLEALWTCTHILWICFHMLSNHLHASVSGSCIDSF